VGKIEFEELKPLFDIVIEGRNRDHRLAKMMLVKLLSERAREIGNYSDETEYATIRDEYLKVYFEDGERIAEDAVGIPGNRNLTK